MKKLIAIMMLITYCFATNAYAKREEQTPWWTVKNHWDKCEQKDDSLCLEYMARNEKYNYTVPHKNLIRKVAILPPAATNRYALKALNYFEMDVLFNMQEMEEEFLMTPKKWKVVKGNKDTYNILRKNNLYDECMAWQEAFISYRTANKDLFSKMADVLGADTFLLLTIGYDRPGALSELMKSEPYYEDRWGIHNIFLFDAKTGKIIWEYGQVLKTIEEYKMTRWRGLYRGIFKKMPIE